MNKILKNIIITILTFISLCILYNILKETGLVQDSIRVIIGFVLTIIFIFLGWALSEEVPRLAAILLLLGIVLAIITAIMYIILMAKITIFGTMLQMVAAIVILIAILIIGRL